MTHLKIQQKNVSEGGSIENVSGAVISALYNISKDPNLVFESSDLKGDLQVSGTYQKYANELHTQYPNLNITALSWYIYFENSKIEQYWATSEYGDGTGITTTSAQSALTFPKRINTIFQEETNLTDSSSSWNGGRFAFYKEDITSFNELGQFSNITTIPYGMFWKCENLTSIDLSNITTLFPRTFSQCSRLAGIINLPKLRNFAARDINISGYNAEGRQFSECIGITEVHFGSDVMAGLKLNTIPEGLFWDSVNLQIVTGLEEVTTIKQSAFRNTSITNLSDLNPNLATVDSYAFRNSPLTCIDITKCTKINGEAFNGCTSLLALDTNNPSEVNNNDTYTLNWTTYDNNGNAVFQNCKLTNKTIILPNLTTIPSGCFKGTNIKKVIAPNVTTLKGESFNGCPNLQELELGNVTIIEDDAFVNCSSLTTIKFGNLVNDFSGLTNIGQRVFQKDRIPNLILPSTLSFPNLTSLKIGAFAKRTEITSVTNLGIIKTLESSSFNDCTNLTSITFPSTLKTCEQIPMNLPVVDWILPEGVTTCGIGQTKSYGSVLKYVELPSTCTDMGHCFHRSFEGQTVDVRLIIKATTPPTLSLFANEIQETKYGLNKMAGIYVPDASLTAYQNAGGIWAYTEMQSKLKPISQLQTDSSYCWNKYQEGLNS